ncbi:hypothetical protein [Variovorax paradoxus]|uniref:hypothetical protein n=1 Tax=Variovorax paradoxus TaxID=34073 RepID=UPI003D64D937
MARRRTVALGLIERAIVEKQWHATSVRAQIHAILGDDSAQFVNAAGRVLYVVLGALIAEEVEPSHPDVRIVRGACNELYEQAGEPVIAPARRASLRSGLEACDRLVGGLQRKSLTDAACELELKLRGSHLDWVAFERLLEGVAA